MSCSSSFYLFYYHGLVFYLVSLLIFQVSQCLLQGPCSPTLLHVKSGYSVTGYSVTGYSVTGYSVTGYSVTGYNVTGYSVTGYSVTGYSVTGYSVTGVYTSHLRI